MRLLNLVIAFWLILTPAYGAATVTRHCTRDTAGTVRCECSIGVRMRWSC